MRFVFKGLRRADLIETISKHELQHYWIFEIACVSAVNNKLVSSANIIISTLFLINTGKSLIYIV
jgi:hypothetical protein